MVDLAAIPLLSCSKSLNDSTGLIPPSKSLGDASTSNLLGDTSWPSEVSVEIEGLSSSLDIDCEPFPNAGSVESEFEFDVASFDDSLKVLYQNCFRQGINLEKEKY